MRQCAHVNPRGTQCRRSAVGPSLFCGHPKHADEATLARQWLASEEARARRAAIAERVAIQQGLPGVDIGQRPGPEDERQAALSQWFTPPPLAAEVVGDVRGLRVLEPSAGDGAIVHAALEAGAEAVLAVEIDPIMIERLRARFAGRPVDVVQGDFLTVEIDPTDFDVVRGNPPYTDGVDGDHLARVADLVEEWHRRGFLEADGSPASCDVRLLLRTLALHSGDRFDRVWTRLAITRLEPVSDRVAFPPAGAAAKAEPGKVDVSIFTVALRSALPPTYVQPVTWIRTE